MIMKKTLLSISVVLAGGAAATPFSGNDAQTNAMGNTGVASASAVGASGYNPALLADYPESVDFGMALFDTKVYVDDHDGFIDAANKFIEEDGTWDKFQAIDSTALEAAVDAIPATITSIEANITGIANATAAIEAAANQTELDTAIADLNSASSSLTSNAQTLDDNVVTVDVQINNIDITVTSANEDLNGLSGKPIQMGIGVDWLKVALPNDTLGWGVTLSTTTIASAKLTVSDSDLTPITDLSSDLTDYTSTVATLSASVTALAEANEALTEHVSNAPAFTDSTYAAWETELEVRQQAVEDAVDNVETAQTAVEQFDGDNGTIVDGEVTISVSDDPQSEIEIVGVSIAEVGVPLARQFNYRAKSIAVGVTPKLQVINVFEKTVVLGDADDEADNVSEDPIGYFQDNSTTLYRGNIDIGAAHSWDYYGQLRVGLAVKDIIPWDLETDKGTTLKIRPKLRAGVAHEAKFTKLALDLDLTENKPLKYGAPTRYLGIGGEVNAWGHAALRLGYRNNLSVDDSHVISTGIGLTPFGTGLDLSAWLKPKFNDSTEPFEDFGLAAQLVVNF